MPPTRRRCLARPGAKKKAHGESFVLRAAWLLAMIGAESTGWVRATTFVPSQSTSFSRLDEDFTEIFLDGSELRGYVANDVVRLGKYNASARFGCVPSSSSGNDWSDDGVLGLGLLEWTAPFNAAIVLAAAAKLEFSCLYPYARWRRGLAAGRFCVHCVCVLCPSLESPAPPIGILPFSSAVTIGPHWNVVYTPVIKECNTEGGERDRGAPTARASTRRSQWL